MNVMNMVKCLINCVHFEDQWTNCILIISKAQKFWEDSNLINVT